MKIHFPQKKLFLKQLSQYVKNEGKGESKEHYDQLEELIKGMNEYQKKAAKTRFKFMTHQHNIKWFDMKEFPFCEKKVLFMLQNLLNSPNYPYPGHATYLVFCKDKYIRELNLEDRGEDKPTDCLSYPFYDFKNPGEIPYDESKFFQLGELVINIPYCEKAADENNTTLAYHLPKVMAHGLFHLLGYDHKTEEDDKIMEKLENDMIFHYLSSVGLNFEPYKTPKSISDQDRDIIISNLLPLIGIEQIDLYSEYRK